MKLLVAYDDNNTTARMMEQAVYRARKMDAFVYLVKTCPPDITRNEIGSLESRLNDLTEDLFTKNTIDYETHILVRGLAPGEDIVRYASEKQVDEIILGIKNRSKVGKMLFGSTAQHIILEAHCPVICVK
jgi:nucleotide-binding universal stress UspA family protein